jgi:WS/DGAT/MGAT family acyltransferase
MPGEDAASTEELPHELLERLAVLHGEKVHAAEAVLSALEERWLELLIDRGVIENTDLSAEEPEPVRLTALGQRVIAAAGSRIHDEHNGVAVEAPERPHGTGVPATLTDELVSRLAILWDESDTAAAAAISAMRYGSLASLVAHGVIEPLDDRRGRTAPVLLTAYGREVIRECARLTGVLSTGALGANAAALLGRETERAPYQLGAVALFSGEPPSKDELCAHLNSRLEHYPLFRERLTKPVRRSGLERWTDDPQFDLANHVVYLAVSEPGEKPLETLLGRALAKELDRSRPPWEVSVIRGLPDGFAVLSRSHYALVENLAGVELLTLLYDLLPSEPVAFTESDWEPREPSQLSLAVSSVGDAVISAATSAVGVVGGSISSPRQALEQLRSTASQVVRGSQRAPESPLNVPVGDGRRIELLDLPLSEVTEVKSAYDAGVSDVVLALLAGALRDWMKAREPDGTPPELRVAAIQATRPQDLGSLSARMVPTLMSLPSDVDDRLERLRRVKAANPGADGETSSGTVTIETTPAASALSLLFRLLSAPLFNVAVADIPGPFSPLYLIDRRMGSLHPFGFLTEEHALTVAFTVYAERLCMSLVGDYEALPDIDTIADGVRDELRAFTRASRRAADRPQVAVR